MNMFERVSVHTMNIVEKQCRYGNRVKNTRTV